MARKASKRSKTAKGRKSVKRAPKQVVLKLPPTFGRVVADAVAQAVVSVTARSVEKIVDTVAVPVSPAQPAVRLANLGADQRFTKNIGNYESFSFGFSLNIPIEVAPDANIESPETRAHLRPKYEATMGFLNEMLTEVGKEIDAARGAVPQ